ncbi:MAG: type IV secretion system DNA-binding domain-containing protein [Desulfobacterales bacterium]|nr:type IV secretion system DNA-binding domain-containing protein [Desulfobacterales bacterium]
MRTELFLGFNYKSKRKVFLSDQSRAMHTHIIGRTNTGKTSHIEHMIRDDIAKGKGICVIDMLGNLYPKLLKFLTYYDFSDRVILFDPSEADYCPALNYFDTFDQRLDPSTVMEASMEGILRIYKQQADGVRPRWETYAPITFEPLIAERLTLLEIMPFVAPHIKTLRSKLLSKYQAIHLRHGWHEFERQKDSEKFSLIEVVYNRGMRFWTNPYIRRIVGQNKNFVDWQKAMDDGKIILCNLGQTARISRKLADMLGVIILHQICQTAQLRRSEHNPRPFYVYVDEFGKIVCKDFEDALDTLRQFGVFFILANQRLGQLKRDVENEDVYTAVMANALLKLAFNVWHEDAEIMAKEIFAQQIHGEDIKYHGQHTLLIPHQEVITLEGDSYGDTSTEGYTDPGYSFTEGIVYDDHLDPLQTSRTQTYPGRGYTGSTASMDSHSSHEALKTEYDREAEDDTPVFYSIEEKTNYYKNQIMKQRQRESKCLIPDRNPISLTTPEVRQIYVDDEYVQKLKEITYKNNEVLSPKEVDLLLNQRYRELLGEDYSTFMENLDKTKIIEENHEKEEDFLEEI